MRNHRTVEFLTAAHTAAELEELYGIRTVRHCLVALRAHLSRTL